MTTPASPLHMPRREDQRPRAGASSDAPAAQPSVPLATLLCSAAVSSASKKSTPIGSGRSATYGAQNDHGLDRSTSSCVAIAQDPCTTSRVALTRRKSWPVAVPHAVVSVSQRAKGTR